MPRVLLVTEGTYPYAVGGVSSWCQLLLTNLTDFDWQVRLTDVHPDGRSSWISDGQLRAYRHTGFWDCMDTYKDAVLLNDLWAAGEAPWKESA